jgi:heme-degrading monooxygenase HmoA
MIARYWRGLAKAECAEAYVAHLRSETFPALKAIPGFAGASILRRAVPEGVEFLVLTNWDALSSIHAFAGADAETAVVPPQVREMMLDFEARARHYEMLA